MDGTGNFTSERDADHGGIETPVNVGTDERRMHVRAYNYWVSLLEGRAYPSIEDLNPENLGDFGPNSVLLDFTGGVDHPAISWLGDKLRIACELPEGVASVADIPSRSLLSRLTDHYMQIIANRAPVGFEAEFTSDAGAEIMYRGILMPFSSDDDTIDFIYGVINWKETADAALSASLADEVSRALEAAPAARHTPNVPAWADGPSRNVPQPGFDADLDAPLELTAEQEWDGEHLSADEAPMAYDADSTEDTDEGFDALRSRADQIQADCLADWLAAARAAAVDAHQVHARSREALYHALGRAYDFALAAEADPDDYQVLLEQSGIVAQPRALMTPVVKLVFGIHHDKTRLAEYALALTHGRRANVARSDFQSFVEHYDGGLKGVIQAERAVRRGAPAERVMPDRIERARQLTPRGIVEMAGSEEFVVLIARRVDEGHVAVLGQMQPDSKLLERALRQIIG